MNDLDHLLVFLSEFAVSRNQPHHRGHPGRQVRGMCGRGPPALSVPQLSTCLPSSRVHVPTCGYFTSISAVLTPAFFSSSVLIAFRYVRQPSAHSSRVAPPRVPNDLHLTLLHPGRSSNSGHYFRLIYLRTAQILYHLQLPTRIKVNIHMKLIAYFLLF
jgi:hypothetical protein